MVISELLLPRSSAGRLINCENYLTISSTVGCGYFFYSWDWNSCLIEQEYTWVDEYLY